MKTPWGAAEDVAKALQAIQKNLEEVVEELKKVNAGLTETNGLLKKQQRCAAVRPPK